MNFDVRSSNLGFVCLLFCLLIREWTEPQGNYGKRSGRSVIIWMCSVMFIKIFLFFLAYFCKKDETILQPFQFQLERGYNQNCGVSQVWRDRRYNLDVLSHVYDNISVLFCLFL